MPHATRRKRSPPSRKGNGPKSQTPRSSAGSPRAPRSAKRTRSSPDEGSDHAKLGPPFKYQPEFLQVAAIAYAQGATDQEVADALSVHVSTLYRWQHEFPEFRAIATVAKSAADERVERSLYHRAVGYSFDAVKIFNDDGSPLLVPYREHVPPDSGAALNWLKNRKPEAWREVQHHEHTFDLGTSATLEAKLRAARGRAAGPVEGATAEAAAGVGPG